MSEADEHIEVPEFLKDGTYVVRARGDEHAPEILVGDVLLVDPDGVAVDGQFVVARIGDEASVERHAAGLTVLGVVTGLMRRLT